MNATAGLLLDATTIFIGTAWFLSAVGAVFPLPAGPAARSREALRIALMPGLGGALVVAAAFWPSFQTWAMGGTDHCEAAHPHLCWLHAAAGPATGHDVLAAVLAVAFLVAASRQFVAWAIAATRVEGLARVNDARRAASLLDALRDAGITFPGAVWVVPADRPWCFVAGVRRPRLVIASSVLDALPPDAIEVIAAHEAAHVRRGDPGLRLLVAIATIAHFPGLGRRAARRWAAAAELACDQAAAVAVGSRLTVAEALVRFQRLVNGAVAQPGIPFGGEAHLEARVQAVLDPPVAGSPRAAAWPWLVAALVVFQAERIHDLVETMLGALHG